MKRLFKESIKVKDILSSNKLADVKVPELLDYVTLKSQLKRTDFEERSAHLFEKVASPAVRALEKAGLTLDEID